MCQLENSDHRPSIEKIPSAAVVAQELDQLRRDATLDATSSRQEYIFPPPSVIDRWLRKSINDERDLPLAYLLFDIACTSLPSALLLWWWPCHSHLVAVCYLVTTYALYLQRFMLTLHFSEHRALFRKEYWVLNLICPYVLAPLLGVPPGMYRLHHCIMHHGGNNRWQMDASSTERYQRDNPLHFVLYWLRYGIGSWVELPWVALRSGRWTALAKCLVLEMLFLGGVPLALRWRFVPALYTVALPFLLSSLALMLGNWSQHIFLDPAQPRRSQGLTYNCVACADNLRSYNDGYHAVHHQNPNAHWTELPALFLSTIDKQARAGTLVFRGIQFIDVGLAVFFRRYEYLARHLVRYTPELAKASPEQLEQLFKERWRPVYI